MADIIFVGRKCASDKTLPPLEMIGHEMQNHPPVLHFFIFVISRCFKWLQNVRIVS